jgi:hypothetical protein
MEFQKKRIKTGEISEFTVPNYHKPMKLFCDMDDIIITGRL